VGRAILISAGEASGDLHAAHLVRALRDVSPGCDVFGLGGPEMASQGVDLVARNEGVAVTGIVEVATHLREVYGAFRRLLREAADRRPALAILVDYPDFNLRLAARLKRLGIPVMYYISPQVWAWRSGRVRTIRRYVDHMVVILPFEEEFYRKSGVSVTFVGHPLVDTAKPSVSRAEFFVRAGLDATLPLVTLLPGSRRKEVEQHLPVLGQAAALMSHRCNFLVVRARSIRVEALRALSPGLAVHDGNVYDALAASDLVLTSCGTATLETALCGAPMIAFYRVSPISYALGRHLVRTDTFAMCNIISGRKVVPELIQGDFTPRRVASEADRLLGDDGERRRISESLARIRHQLGEPGAPRRAAEIAGRLIAGRARQADM